MRVAPMLAARYLGPHQIEAIEIERPSIADEHALIRVSACGFCGSDLGIVAGLHPRAREPLTLGHEFCGTVEEIGVSNSDLRRGDFVAAYPLISCGMCLVCRMGLPHVCKSLRLYGIDADGGMAEFVRIPLANLRRLPVTMTPIEGAVVEPLAVAVHGVLMAAIEHTNTAVVLGAGPIGLLTALVAKSRGISSVVVSDVLPFRLELAKNLGFEIAAAGKELEAAVREKTRDEGADLIFECAGSPSTALAMTSLVRSRGTIINLGVFKKPSEVNLQAINFKEIRLLGSRVYTESDFAEAIKCAQQLPVAKIVTHTFPLHQVKEAFSRFREGTDVCKVLLLPNG